MINQVFGKTVCVTKNHTSLEFSFAVYMQMAYTHILNSPIAPRASYNPWKHKQEHLIPTTNSACLSILDKSSNSLSSILQSHYPNWVWLIVSWNPRKNSSNLPQNTKTYFQEKAVKILAIKFLPFSPMSSRVKLPLLLSDKWPIGITTWPLPL